MEVLRASEPPPILRVLVALVAAKAGIAFLGAPWISQSLLQDPANWAVSGTIHPSVTFLAAVVYAAGGALLVIGGRQDERSVLLGGFFFCLAGMISDRPMEWLIASESPWPGIILRTARWLPASALIPYVFWRFFSTFPQISGHPKIERLMKAGTQASMFVGLVMLTFSIPLLFDALDPAYSADQFFHEFDHLDLRPIHDTLMILPVLGAFAAGIWRSLHARHVERRRVRLLVAGLSLGLLPFLLVSVTEALVPPFREWVAIPQNKRLVGYCAIYTPMLSIPFTTAYAVLVHRVLDVRLIARKALRYALARYSALALAAVPPVGLAMYLYQRRAESLEQIFSGSSAILLSLTTILGISLLVKRQALIDAVDRKFFREHYDARQILTPLVERIRNTTDRSELADLVCHGIDRALHLETIALLIDAPERGELADPTKVRRPLMLSGPLVSLVGSSREPLDVGLENGLRDLPHLSASDRDWLLDGAFSLLVPIVSFDGALLGIIAMGEKKSGLPILKEDRQLLAAIANSAALALEVQRLRRQGAGSGTTVDTPIPSLPTASPAQECFGCGRLYLPHNQTCPTCERELEPALVPYVMPGRFRFERRLGAGGMGVVYRAVDLSLSRPVAIKTMRRVSVDDALRLRREARAAAAVVHPNLALIYLVESWQGNPMLIMEYLEKGTLGDRLSEQVMGPHETLRLGSAMASALEKLHSANILHRDLKPSNIGYSLDGTPKLMDFGIARLQFDLRREAAVLTDGPTAVHGMDTFGWAQMGTPATASRQLVGTLHYLSPEAIHGVAPDPTFDLWSLTAVLYECLTGARIFRGTLAEVMAAIGRAEVPPLNERRPNLPPLLTDFFSLALHADKNRRPSTARELQERLDFLHQRV